MIRHALLTTTTLAIGMAAAHAAAIYLGDTRNGGAPPSGVTNPGDGGGVDGWSSNMVVLPGQGFTAGSDPLVVTEFNFMVGNNRGRVTPFVVEVVSPTDFNVLAIGTTRVSGVDYTATGIQNLAFSDGGPVALSTSPGMTIAAGFLNSDADGSNTGGSVIPFDGNLPPGAMWYNGNAPADTYPNGVPTDGSLAGAPLADVNNRAYDFNIGVDVIPEPSSAFLTLFGLGSLLIFRRRR